MNENFSEKTPLILEEEKSTYKTIPLASISTPKIDKQPLRSKDADPQATQLVDSDLPKSPNIVPDDYNEKYNIVIRQYNHDINRIGYVYLSELPPHSAAFKWALFICLFFFQPALFVLIPIAIVRLVKERKIIHENSRLVPNVFENMLYISQHCRRFHCVFKYWSCKIEEKEGKEVIFLGNQEFPISSFEVLKRKRIQNSKQIQVMTFDSEFQSWYYEALKSNRNLIIAFISLLVFLVAFCIFLAIVIYKLLS